MLLLKQKQKDSGSTSLTFYPRNSIKYEVVLRTIKKTIGFLETGVDGYWYFHTNVKYKDQYWGSGTLREIADALETLNSEIDFKMKRGVDKYT